MRWPLEPLELCALRGVAGTMVGSDQLIAAALDALLSGADSPALRQLAGLTRSEEPDAHDLFDQTVEELGIASTLPLEPTLARWELARRWCQMIVDGRLAPEVGARLIGAEGPTVDDDNHPLLPFAGLLSEFEDWRPEWDVPREAYLASIIDVAQQLLSHHWPPVAQYWPAGPEKNTEDI